MLVELLIVIGTLAVGPTAAYGLTADTSFVTDVTSATSNIDPNVSLYLLATDDTLGMTLPTLSFDVTNASGGGGSGGGTTSVPTPAAAPAAATILVPAGDAGDNKTANLCDERPAGHGCRVLSPAK